MHTDAIDAFIGVKRNEAVGQFDLFGDLPGLVVTPPIMTTEWDKSDLLAFEREMLGLYVSDHPLSGLEDVLTRSADMAITALFEDGAVADGQIVHLAGILSGVAHK